METYIIKIQRQYRVYKINENIKLFNRYDLKYIDKIIFSDYTTKLLNKDIIYCVKSIINKLNELFDNKLIIQPQYILSSFLIKNFSDDILGPIKDRHPIDIYMYQWSIKLVQIFTKFDNTYNECKLLYKYLINYKDIFDNWKNVDKNRTIQNIIVSYYHRQEHLNYIKTEEMDIVTKDKIIKGLNQESNNLLISIKQIDKDFDIDNLKVNYKEIYNEIQNSMRKIYNSISTQFKKAYLEILIDEYKNNNSRIIYDLIIDTNSRLILLCPEKYKNSITKKVNNYDYINILLNKSITIKDYIEFMIDTLLVLSSPNDDKDNIKWKDDLLSLNLNKNYESVLPTIIVEINNKIDHIFNQIYNLL